MITREDYLDSIRIWRKAHCPSRALPVGYNNMKKSQLKAIVADYKVPMGQAVPPPPKKKRVVGSGPKMVKKTELKPKKKTKEERMVEIEVIGDKVIAPKKKYQKVRNIKPRKKKSD